MSTQILVRFLLATAIVTVIPGPNILLIVNDSIHFGFKNGFKTVLGVSAGMIPLFLLSLAGISALIIKRPWLFNGLKILGACYLIYLGSRMIRAFFYPALETKGQAPSQGRFFRRGLLVCMSNPKGLFFAGAFFPQFINPATPVGLQVFCLITGCLVVATLIGAGYSLFAQRASTLFQSDRFSRYSSLISGGILILFGLGFMLSN